MFYPYKIYIRRKPPSLPAIRRSRHVNTASHITIKNLSLLSFSKVLFNWGMDRMEAGAERRAPWKENRRLANWLSDRMTVISCVLMPKKVYVGFPFCFPRCWFMCVCFSGGNGSSDRSMIDGGACGVDRIICEATASSNRRIQPQK